MFVSVIIPTYYRSDKLRNCLLSLKRQVIDPGSSFEIIVVDNSHSSPATETVVREFRRDFSGTLRFFREKRTGVAYARNRGIIEARGDVVAFLDDDVTADRRWLLSLYRVFSRYKPHAVQGAILLQLPSTLPEGVPQWFLNKRFTSVWHGDEVGEMEASDLVGANMAVRKQVFRDIGVFNPEYNKYRCDDTELSRRLRRHGLTMLYCPQAKGYHHINADRLTLKSFVRQSYLQGRAHAIFDPQDLPLPEHVYSTTKGALSDIAICIGAFMRHERTGVFLSLNEFSKKIGILRQYITNDYSARRKEYAIHH